MTISVKSEFPLQDVQSPVLVLADSLHHLEPTEWSTGEAFVKALERESGLKAVILPLELSNVTAKRQQLWGVDLLNWMRWSVKEPVCDLPVLCLAWQPLVSILRKRSNLLLISEGCRFARLP